MPMVMATSQGSVVGNTQHATQSYDTFLMPPWMARIIESEFKNVNLIYNLTVYVRIDGCGCAIGPSIAFESVFESRAIVCWLLAESAFEVRTER